MARLLRASTLIIPLALSLGTTLLVRPFLPHPTGLVGQLQFFAPPVLVSVGVAVATERVARRLLPLAALMELSLVFPDRAPPRYSVALRSGSTKKLAQETAELRESGFSSDWTVAPTQILDMMNALRLNEPLTHGHAERVRAYGDLIAEELGLPDKERSLLSWAILLHDIGKLAVPAEILSKDGKPTEEEWKTLAAHPEVGARMVEPLAPWLGEHLGAARDHHERWDGTGYPTGLAGTDISLAGRIVAVADAYDVITSARSYKSPMSPWRPGRNWCGPPAHNSTR